MSYLKGREYRLKHKLQPATWTMYFGITKQDPILDFGCGIGHRVHVFRSSGYNCEGYDIDQDAIKYAFRKAKGHIYDYIRHDYYYFIYSVDVFEHITDDCLLPIIKNISSLTKKFLVGITFSDDSNYKYDKTHVNPKTKDEWKEFLSPYFDRVYDAPDWFYFNEKYLYCMSK